jgi:hypothetical protein
MRRRSNSSCLPAKLLPATRHALQLPAMNWFKSATSLTSKMVSAAGSLLLEDEVSALSPSLPCYFRSWSSPLFFVSLVCLAGELDSLVAASTYGLSLNSSIVALRSFNRASLPLVSLMCTDFSCQTPQPPAPAGSSASIGAAVSSEVGLPTNTIQVFLPLLPSLQY